MNQVIARMMSKIPAASSRMMKTILVFTFFFSILNCQGQTLSIIDSLENLIKKSKEDTTLVNRLNSISWQLKNINSYELSLFYADSALVLAEKLKYEKGAADAFTNKSRLVGFHGNFTEAMENNNRALNIYRKIDDKKGIALSLNLIGGIYQYQSNIPEALKNYLESKKISEEIGYTRGIAVAALNIGEVYNVKGKFEEALNNYFESLEIFIGLGEKQLIAATYRSIGIIYSNQGNYKEALNNFVLSKKITEEFAGKASPEIYSDIGIVYQNLGNYSEALKYFQTALEISKDMDYKRGMANAYHNIGVGFAALGNYPEAVKNYLLALRIHEELGDKSSVADIYANIGNIYKHLANYPEAMNNMTLALQIYEETENKLNIARTKNNIGNIYKNQGNYAEALKYYEASLKISEEIGDKKGLISSFGNIGSSSADNGNYPEALAYYSKALTISLEIGEKSFLDDIYNGLGTVSFDLSNYSGARKYLNEGLAIAKETGTIEQVMESYQYLTRLDSAEGNFKEALENYKLYTLYEDSLLSEDTRRQIERMKIEYETEKKDKEIELLNKDNEIKSLQLSRQKALRHGMIAGIVLIFITGYLLFRSFRLRKKLEQQQAIIGERKRISADLHDDVGSGLSRIMLLTELVKKEARTPEMQKEAEKIASISKELSSNISEIIWALNANNDYLESLVAYIRRYAAEFFDDSAVKLSIKSTGKISGIPISGELRREIFYTVKEALHNIYKHAQASEAVLSFSVENEALTIVIQDNGIGMPEKDTGRYGNGLTNMQQRMAAAGGIINIENHQGTKITLAVPVR